MKTEVGRPLVLSDYREHFVARGFDGGNQLEEQLIIANQIEELIGPACKFHLGESEDVNFVPCFHTLSNWYNLDSQGCSSNFMHPAIEHFCHSMLYTATDPIAKQFPDEFETEVPEHAVAVTITCVGSPFALIYSTDSSEWKIYHCLDEFWGNGYRISKSFSSTNYQDIYKTILELISQLRTNQYHKKKWDEARKKWAQKGM